MTRIRFLLILLLVTMNVSVYCGSLYGDFVFDDIPRIAKPLPADWSDVYSEGRPITGLVWHAVWSWERGQFVPLPSHVVSVVLHLLNILLVLAILLESNASFPAAYLAAMIFGVHPMLTQAVSYAAAQSTLLCALFYFLGMWGVLRFLHAIDTDRKTCYAIGVVSCFVLGLLAKQEITALPILTLFFYYIHRGKKSHLWPILVVLLLLLTAFIHYGGMSTLYPDENDRAQLGIVVRMSPLQGIMTNLASVPGYFLPRFVMPLRLSLEPDIIHITSLDLRVFLTLLAWCGLLYGALTTRPSNLTRLGFASLFAAPWLVRSLSVLNANWIEEHHAYIPMLGLAFLIAGEIDRSRDRHLEVETVTTAVLVIAVFIFMTINRNTLYSHRHDILYDAAMKASTNPRPWSALGVEDRDLAALTGNIFYEKEANAAYKHALALRPTFYLTENDLGVQEIDLHDYKSAEVHLRHVVTHSTGIAAAYVNLGVVYIKQFRLYDAEKELDFALKLNPNMPAALFNKGEVARLRGDKLLAADYYSKAIALDPRLKVDLQPEFKVVVVPKHYGTHLIF